MIRLLVGQRNKAEKGRNNAKNSGGEQNKDDNDNEIKVYWVKRF